MRLFGRRRGSDRPPPSYSNEAVISRIQEEAEIDRATARAWFNEMLIFLDLAADSKDFISPPGPVDAAWHAFILHTRDYEAYCRERFGRVIHHEPTGKPDPNAYRRAYERRTRQGEIDPAIWAVPAVGGAAAASEFSGDVGSGHDGGGGFWDGGGFGGGDGGGGGCGGGG
jgi:uncharacterized membrane protein YgcG